MKRTKPADLPVERSMQLGIVINLNTTQALGLVSLDLEKQAAATLNATFASRFR